VRDEISVGNLFTSLLNLLTTTTRNSGPTSRVAFTVALASFWLAPGCLQPGSFDDEEQYRLKKTDATTPLPEAGTDAPQDSGRDAPVGDTQGTPDTNQPIPDSAPGDTNQPPTGQTIWIEAESAAGVSAPLAITDDATAAGGKYLSAPTTALNATPDTATSVATYMFTVNAMGTFMILGRVRAPSMDNDSFWIKMDQGEWIQWNNLPASTDWVWDDVHDTGMADARVTFMLSPGSHTFSVTYREQGTALDKLVVTTNLTLMPEGMGGQ
jgi:hypothetical protein